MARPGAAEGWPDGGQVAGRWRVCTGCRDDIGPEEHVYPAAGGGSDTDGVLCAVCEVARQRLLAALVDERYRPGPLRAA